jgi:hypothetical protein
MAVDIAPAVFGGTLIGLAAAVLLLATGKTAGVSGVIEGVRIGARSPVGKAST